jgi:hypothetical protein
MALPFRLQMDENVIGVVVGQVCHGWCVGWFTLLVSHYLHDTFWP